ncbi:MAG: hypothetical protein ACE5FN_12645, partial [Leptospirillia bacterium]
RRGRNLSTFHLKRIARPDDLKTIGHDHLLALLAPHEDFFSRRGVALPPVGSVNGIPYDDLAGIFVSPGADTPQALVDALYLINGMATQDCMDALLQATETAGVRLDAPFDATPADVAVRTWLQAPDLMEQKHAEQHIKRPRSFVYFQTDTSPVPPFRMPGRKTLTVLQDDLDDWFEEKLRGRACRVFAYELPDGIKFLVRHGEPIKREGSIEDGKASSVVYRPAKHDVLAYDPALGELSINARSKAERELYRTRFGLHLFGDSAFFPGEGKYTLEPLRTDWERALVCTDINGMEWIEVKEVRVRDGDPPELLSHKAEGTFATLVARKKRLPDEAELVQATFLVKFPDSRTPRAITIRPSNIATYTRDGDSGVVEQWLVKRGFIIAQDQEVEADELVAGA